MVQQVRVVILYMFMVGTNIGVEIIIISVAMTLELMDVLEDLVMVVVETLLETIIMEALEVVVAGLVELKEQLIIQMLVVEGVVAILQICTT